MTKFEEIYNVFLGKITDDMYMEWTKEDTLRDLQGILLNAIPGFEFPRFNLYDYQTSELVYDDKTGEVSDASYFTADLTKEEINIFAILMVNEWIQRQMASIENIRMKYSGQDYKFTSQANHLAKLINLKTEMEKQDRHMQRLYKRRIRKENGLTYSNWDILLRESAIDEY